MTKTYENLKSLIKSDLRKISIDDTWGAFIKKLLLNESFKRILVYRLSYAYRNNVLLKIPLRILERYISRHYNVYIRNVEIGSGLLIPHCFSIMVASGSVIGKNCCIMQQVTIGSSRAGSRGGFPILGDNVMISTGAKIIGKVRIGNNVIVGANAVVTKDVPDNAIVVGVPAKILNFDGETQIKYWCSDLRDYLKLIK